MGTVNAYQDQSPESGPVLRSFGGEQPFLFGETWVPVRDGNLTGLSIFMRHYTARLTRRIRQFVGPGGKMVLLTPDARALFTYVDASQVRHKRDPGRCFLRAGFRYCGLTKSGKRILECVQSTSPEASVTPTVLNE
jgi:hypothetical protein